MVRRISPSGIGALSVPGIDWNGETGAEEIVLGTLIVSEWCTPF